MIFLFVVKRANLNKISGGCKMIKNNNLQKNNNLGTPS
jgi:hypothetical protein